MNDLNDFSEIPEQLASRKNDRVRANNEAATLFLLSKSDLGVCRNGGRKGAAYGPKALMNTLTKMNAHDSKKGFSEQVICENEQSNFTLMQSESQKLIEKYKPDHNCIAHIGGGHDHIYPLLKAYAKDYKKISVINIDAHLDTRTDKAYHSGTPFRQFDNEYEGQFKLLQIGIHNFANSESTFEHLKNGSMKVITYDQLEKRTQNNFLDLDGILKQLIKDFVNEDELLILSLDCDAISSDTMEAVSAVNHKGIPMHGVQRIFSLYNELTQKQDQRVFGVYEFNPIFDTLSGKSARALSALLYEQIL